MGNFGLNADEVVLYENYILCSGIKGSVYFTFTSQKMVFEKEEIESAIRKGIAQTIWKGRMEILSYEPFFMIDGAHNAHGVAALHKSLMTMYPGEKFHFIMGVMADKDYEEMIEELLPLAVDFTTITVESERALQAEELADCIQKKGVKAECAKDLLTLFAVENGDSNVKTIAFGSLYFIGEIKSLQNLYKI